MNNKNNKQNSLKIFSLISLLSISLINCAQNINDIKTDETLKTTNIIKDINTLKGSTIGQYQKPGAPIDITYSSTVVPTAGDIIKVTLTFTGDLKPNNKIKVSITPDKSLEIYNFTGPVVFDMSITNTIPEINLSIYSSKLSLVYLNIFVDYFIDNKIISSRVFAVPVKTGKNSKPSLQKVGNTHRDSEGNLLIIQEVETIVQ